MTIMRELVDILKLVPMLDNVLSLSVRFVHLSTFDRIV